MTAEIAQGTVHVRHKVLTRPQATFALVKYKHASPGKALKDCVRLCCLPCQLGENKRVCSSYGSPHFLPASQPAPCLPWVQGTVLTVRQSVLGVGSAPHKDSALCVRVFPPFPDVHEQCSHGATLTVGATAGKCQHGILENLNKMFSWRAAVLKVWPMVPEGLSRSKSFSSQCEVLSAFFTEQWFIPLVDRAPERSGWGGPQGKQGTKLQELSRCPQPLGMCSKNVNLTSEGLLCRKMTIPTNLDLGDTCLCIL